MNVTQICNSIIALFKKKIPPMPQLPRSLVVSSSVKKEGLSTIKSTSNVVTELNKLGIPTDKMPDGSPNLTIAFIQAITEERNRSLKFDASFQVGIQPGSMMLTAIGANGGGPITVQGVNTSTGIGSGAIL